MSVKAPGFKDQARNGIKVDVSQNVGADFAMAVVGAKETVNVSTAAPLLGTEDATTGQVVDRKLINDLPLIETKCFGIWYFWRPASRKWMRHAWVLRQQLHLQRQPERHR